MAHSSPSPLRSDLERNGGLQLGVARESLKADRSPEWVLITSHEIKSQEVQTYR